MLLPLQPVDELTKSDGWVNPVGITKYPYSGVKVGLHVIKLFTTFVTNADVKPVISDSVKEVPEYFP